MLPVGHKLGEPSPLFAKIEVAKIEELKKKYAGTQNDRQNQTNVNSVNIKSLEEAVAKQVCVKLLYSSYIFYGHKTLIYNIDENSPINALPEFNLKLKMVELIFPIYI